MSVRATDLQAGIDAQVVQERIKGVGDQRDSFVLALLTDPFPP